MSVGERIKQLRKLKKMSQASLASLIGVSRGAIANYEVNMTEPKYENYKLLSKTLGTSISFLKTGEISEKKELPYQVPLLDFFTFPSEPFSSNSNYSVDSSIFTRDMYAIRIASSEMHPTIQENDICYCVYNREQLIEDNMIVHYSFRDNNGIRIIKVDEEMNQISLVPLNLEKHKIITIPSKDFHLLKRAKIITITRNL